MSGRCSVGDFQGSVVFGNILERGPDSEGNVDKIPWDERGC